MACEDLVFAVNGERFEVFSVHPSTTLLEFLRSSTPFKSSKLSCGEGTHTDPYIHFVIFLMNIGIFRACIMYFYV